VCANTGRNHADHDPAGRTGATGGDPRPPTSARRLIHHPKSAQIPPNASPTTLAFHRSSKPGAGLAGAHSRLVRITGSHLGAGGSSTDLASRVKGRQRVHRSRAPQVHHRVACREKDWPPRPPVAKPFPPGSVDSAAASATMRLVLVRFGQRSACSFSEDAEPMHYGLPLAHIRNAARPSGRSSTSCATCCWMD
jgi:hypothetical protein